MVRIVKPNVACGDGETAVHVGGEKEGGGMYCVRLRRRASCDEKAKGLRPLGAGPRPG